MSVLSSLQAARLEGNPAEKGWPGEKINLLAITMRMTQASLLAKQLLCRGGGCDLAAQPCRSARGGRIGAARGDVGLCEPRCSVTWVPASFLLGDPTVVAFHGIDLWFIVLLGVLLTQLRGTFPKAESLFWRGGDAVP